ncbi:sodium- and chloride-dependent neutral and basic amino acid transporter B(0+)-like [Clavelina lepadiformis]|uniref:Transporter n=1 Tax=Clavelina lepadiformis TaxID=159417 RepID=A0ABP0H2C5_CLALP
MASGKDVSEQDENKDRGNWDRKADYMLSCIGYAVGLGNVWRFPYLAFENGGGAFLIPYVIMLVFAGLPIFFLECALGQFSSLGPISAFKFSPILKGIGYCMVILNILVSIYYNIIIAYTVFYFFSSLTAELPWNTCDNFWNTRQCTTNETDKIVQCNLLLSSETLNNASVTTFLNLNDYEANSNNIVTDVLQSHASNLAGILRVNFSEICFNETSFLRTSSSEEYWENYALQRSADIDHTDGIVTGMVLSLLVAWIVVYFSMIRGIKSSGKVVYFTAIFPYVVLIILLVRGATLPGAREGLEFYIGSRSDLSKLANAEVWQAAATQIFFSLSAAWGGLIALSSYNKFQNNCFYDSVIVCFINCATSIFAGLSIFTVVGHLAYKLGREVDDVVKSGFSLAFVAYPEALAQLWASPLWAILFFLMLFTLGLDSQFTGVEAILTAAMDLFPKKLRKRRALLTLSSVIIFFLLGIPCVAGSGVYWLNLIDHYSAGWGLLIMAVCEVIGVNWVYGGNRFIKDIEMMIGKKNWVFWLYWRACWFFITPLLLLAILIWSLVTFTAPDYAGVPYPDWANALGWCSIAVGLMFLPIMAVVALIQCDGNLFKAALPAKDWGPYLKQFRGERYADMAEPQEALALNEGNDKGQANPTYEADEAMTKL